MTSQFNAHKKYSLSWLTILLFAIIAVAFFFILFPQKVLRETIVSNPDPSALSIEYLKNLIQQDPTNTLLKINLAKQEFEMGHVNEAENLIKPYLTTTPISEAQWKGLMLQYQIIRAKAFALAPENTIRKNDEQALEALLPTVVNSPYLDKDDIMILISDTLAFNKPKIAVYLYKMAVRVPQDLSVSFYENGAKVALFTSDYQTSATFYKLAMEHSATTAEKRQNFTHAVESLIANGDPASALDFAKNNLGELSKDKSTLLYLSNLALKANQPKIAEHYVTQALQLRYEE